MRYLESALGGMLLLGISIILMQYCSLSTSAQFQKTSTKIIPLTFTKSFVGNKKWINPIHIIDGDEESYSYPVVADYYDEDSVYYNIILERPLDRSGKLIDDFDYGTILKVQVKLVFGLQRNFALTRYSYVDVEGYVRRLENVEIAGPGLGEKLVEIVDVTSAKKKWEFTSPLQWDEIVIRFSSEEDYLEDGIFRLYEVQLLVTYVPKRNIGG